MEWEKEAEKAVKQVPFFVRKKVKSRVEEEAQKEGKNRITLKEVEATRKRFLSNMDSEIKGYQLDACFGPGGCPNRTLESERLTEKLEMVLKEADIAGFLRTQVKGPLKYHHEFRVTVSECPNACSQPQIKDVGIIGARRPFVTENDCTFCEACTACCDESAIDLQDDGPVLLMDRCVMCGKCIDACPEKVIGEQEKGYRIQLGGKLGRHPMLARELGRLFSQAETVDMVRKCLQYYKEKSTGGKRFAEILAENDDEFIRLLKG
ncbi:MAG: 4Fe-4S binding protein [Proteobacteria bacterium]|nr:4Fe-4S binding protein [Pseudomonadota bacterium]